MAIRQTHCKGNYKYWRGERKRNLGPPVGMTLLSYFEEYVSWRCQGIFAYLQPFAVTFYDLSKLCAKATSLLHLGQIVLGVSFDSRYFYSFLNFDVCLNCKTLDLV